MRLWAFAGKRGLSDAYGEMLYQLRAALDGSVYQAAIIESGQDPPPNENRLEFPICVSAAEFHKSAWKIAPLSKQCRDFIESIQPYNAPELAAPLVVLNMLDEMVWTTTVVVH